MNENILYCQHVTTVTSQISLDTLQHRFSQPAAFKHQSTVSLTNKATGAFLSPKEEDVALGATRSLRESQDLWCELGHRLHLLAWKKMIVPAVCELCCPQIVVWRNESALAHAENKNKLITNADTSWAQRLSIRLEKCPCQSNCTYYVFDGFCPGLQDPPFVRKWSGKFPMNEYQLWLRKSFDKPRSLYQWWNQL